MASGNTSVSSDGLSVGIDFLGTESVDLLGPNSLVSSLQDPFSVDVDVSIQPFVDSSDISLEGSISSDEDFSVVSEVLVVSSSEDNSSSSVSLISSTSEFGSSHGSKFSSLSVEGKGSLDALSVVLQNSSVVTGSSLVESTSFFSEDLGQSKVGLSPVSSPFILSNSELSFSDLVG